MRILPGAIFLHETTGSSLFAMLCDRRTILLLAASLSVAGGSVRGESISQKAGIIDDLSREPPLAAIGSRWQLFTDQVMGGVSNGTMARETVAGRPAIRMCGNVEFLKTTAASYRLRLISPPMARPSMPALGEGSSSMCSATARNTAFTYAPRIWLATLAVLPAELSCRSAVADDPVCAFKTSCHIGPRRRSMPAVYDALAWLRSAARFRRTLPSAGCDIWPDPLKRLICFRVPRLVPVISCHRRTMTSTYLGSSSISRARRPACSAAISVVPEPPKGSNTMSRVFRRVSDRTLDQRRRLHRGMQVVVMRLHEAKLRD